MLPKSARLEIFIARLAGAPAALSELGALDLVCRILNDVEEEHSGIPFDPSTRGSDGRMYPPQADSRRMDHQSPRVARYRTRGHHLLIGCNGAIAILSAAPGASTSPILEKAGSDGRTVEVL